MTVVLKAVPDATEHPMDDLSDDDLMRLAAIGRKDAFEILVIRHHAFVFGLAARFLGDRQAGRDIAQDVFLALWADRDKYQRRGMFKSYLAAVCLNRCRVAARGMKNQDKRVKRLQSEVNGDSGEDRLVSARLVSAQRDFFLFAAFYLETFAAFLRLEA
jgi:DNA-directed RNA polymerase specialized sigma24 family protein